MKLEDEVNDLIGVEVDGWIYTPESESANATLWFAHTPSKDKPEGQPLTWSDLETLNEVYDIDYVESNSSGKTGSRLAVAINNP